MGELHLRLLSELLELIERYEGTITREQLERDRETWLKVRGALELAAQCCIDLALGIVASRGLGVPQSYREAFGMIAQAKVIDDAAATELQSWAGLRNVLAHVYTALDLDLVLRALSETKPLREFLAVAARELSRAP